MSRLPRVAADLVRTIYFHRIINDDTTNFPVDWDAVAEYLSEADRETREHRVDVGEVVRLRVRKSDEPFHITLTRVRKVGLPMIEHDTEEMEPIEVDDDAGISETTHVVVANDVIISEYNHDGPRVTNLLRFVQRAVSGAGGSMAGARVGQLIRGAVFGSLSRAGAEVKLLRIRVPTALIGKVREADESLGESLAAVSAIGPADDVELILRRAVSEEHPEGMRGFGRLLELAANLLPFRKQCKLQATVKPAEGRQVPVDLFGDPVQVDTPFPLVNDRTRRVAEAAAFAAIEAAYRNNRAEVRAARPI